MPSKSPEPSNYSLDEMMDRLREGDREKRDSEESGELVTRPDGTKVMRVKKRKRRTEQATTKQVAKREVSKKTKLVTGAILLALLLMMLVGALLQLAKFNSQGYHEQVEGDLSSSVGGDFSISRFTVTPVKARAEKVVVKWPESSLMESASLRHLEAGLGFSGFLGSAWKGHDLRARTGELRFQGGAGKSYPVISGELPFHYEEFLCDEMDLYFGAGENPPVKFEGVELSVRGEAGTKQVIIHGGDMELRGWGRMAVGNGVVRLEDEGCVLSTLRLKPDEGRGDIVVKGDQVILPGKDTEFEMSLSNIGLSHLLGKNLGALLDGTVSSENGRIVFSAAGFTDSSFILPVEGTGGQLTGLPFLFSLRTILSDTEFAKPYFRNLSATIHRKGDEVMLKDLVLSEKGFMEVRGSMEIKGDGRLSGNLRVGIHENKALSATGRLRSRVFSDPVGGYAWVEVALGGTVDIPEDNWNDLLRNAAREAANERRIRE